jgi:hypothetical protein
MKKELLKLKKYFNKILNTNVESHLNESISIQTLALDGLHSIEIIEELSEELGGLEEETK